MYLARPLKLQQKAKLLNRVFIFNFILLYVFDEFNYLFLFPNFLYLWFLFALPCTLNGLVQSKPSRIPIIIANGLEMHFPKGQ